MVRTIASVAAYLTRCAASATLCLMVDSNGNPILKSRQEQLVEIRFGEPVEALLRRLYIEEGLTQEQIAERLGVGRRSIIRWFGKYGLVGRHPRDRVAEAVA